LATLLCNTLFIASILASQGNAQSAITAAKKAIVNAYGAVAQAESTGAEVNSLIATLNEAAILLSKAELYYAGKDYDLAYSYAKQSQGKIVGVTQQASELEQETLLATSQSNLHTFLTLAVSISVLFVGIGVWTFLSKQEKRHSHETAFV
jgi:hypothetical protein